MTGVNADGPVHLAVSQDEDSCIIHLTVVCNSCYDAMLITDKMKQMIAKGGDFEVKFSGQTRSQAPK